MYSILLCFVCQTTTWSRQTLAHILGRSFLKLHQILLIENKSHEAMSTPRKRTKLGNNPIHKEFDYNCDADQSKCHHCPISLKGKNPTSLKKHTESKHPSIYKKYLEAYDAEMTSLNSEGSSGNDHGTVPLLPSRPWNRL